MTVSYLLSGVLHDYYVKTTGHLLYAIDPEIHASAYKGLHDKTFAESEFAGKYMDICATYGASAVSAADRQRALNNAAYVARAVAANQRDDGYIGGVVPELEWEGFSVWNMAFTAYGLISYSEISGDEEAMKSAKKILYCIADHFLEHPEVDILDAFGNGTAHLSVLLPASRFYRMTGDARVGELLAFIRNRLDGSTLDFMHFDDLLKLKSQKGIEIFVLLIGLCDYGEYTKDSEILAGCERYWQQLRDGQIRNDGNGTIGEYWYEGGNAPQYLDMEARPNENCVAVGWLEFSVTLYKLTGKMRYLNVLDRTLYNHVLGALDPDGKDFAYYQPNIGKRNTKTPEDMYKCCRYRGYSLFSRLPSVLFLADGDRLTAGVYASCRYEDDSWRVTEQTDFPYKGDIRLEVERTSDIDGELRLRIPENASILQVTAEGTPASYQKEEGCIVLSCKARAITSFELKLRLIPTLSRGMIDKISVLSYSQGPVLLVAETEPDGDWKTLSADSNAELIATSEPNYRLSFLSEKTRIVDYASSGRNDGREFTVWIKEETE